MQDNTKMDTTTNQRQDKKYIAKGTHKKANKVRSRTKKSSAQAHKGRDQRKYNNERLSENRKTNRARQHEKHTQLK